MKLKLAFLAAVLALLIGGIVFVQTAPPVLAQTIPGKLSGLVNAPFTYTDVNAVLQAGSLTTTGSSGAATLSGGVLNIPQYSVGGGLTTPTVITTAVTTTNTILALVSGYSITIPANKLASGNSIDVVYWVSPTNTADDAFLTLNNTTAATANAISSSTGLGNATKPFVIRCSIWGTGSNTQTAACTNGRPGAAGDEQTITNLTLTTSSTIILAVAATSGGSSNNIVSKYLQMSPVNW